MDRVRTRLQPAAIAHAAALYVAKAQGRNRVACAPADARGADERVRVPATQVA